MVEFHGDGATLAVAPGDLANGFCKVAPAQNGAVSGAESPSDDETLERQRSGLQSSTSDACEPLLEENDDRYTFFPIKYGQQPLPEDLGVAFCVRTSKSNFNGHRDFHYAVGVRSRPAMPVSAAFQKSLKQQATLCGLC